jgi:hypothetical protein
MAGESGEKSRPGRKAYSLITREESPSVLAIKIRREAFMEYTSF